MDIAFFGEHLCAGNPVSDHQCGLIMFDDTSGGCSMCLAIPGKIVALDPRNESSAIVDVLGTRRTIDLGLLQDDRPAGGDWVLIHVGFAMSKISEVDALEQLRLLEMLGESEAALQEVRGYGFDSAEDADSVE
jgi:hydrogenase expression/formation protein HypC